MFTLVLAKSTHLQKALLDLPYIFVDLQFNFIKPVFAKSLLAFAFISFLLLLHPLVYLELFL